MTSHLDELSRAIADANSAAQQEWSAAAPAAVKIEGLRDFRGSWKRRAAGAVVGAGALGAALLGAKVGALAGGIRWADRRRYRGDRRRARHCLGQLSSKEGAIALQRCKGRILEENRELLRVEIGNVLEELQRQTRIQIDTIIRQVRADLILNGRATSSGRDGCA